MEKDAEGKGAGDIELTNARVHIARIGVFSRSCFLYNKNSISLGRIHIGPGQNSHDTPGIIRMLYVIHLGRFQLLAEFTCCMSPW